MGAPLRASTTWPDALRSGREGYPVEVNVSRPGTYRVVVPRPGDL